VTGAVLDRPGSLFDAASVRPGGEQPIAGGRFTLEERLTAGVHEAQANGSTECPVCRARMTFTHAGATPGAAPVAECGGCGSRLS
jgi:hypothetical protein